jgi:hypothetical protein
MKNLRSILLALTVLLLATAAEAQTTNVKVSIPFDFVVGDRAYSAGEYTIKSMSDNGLVIQIGTSQQPALGMARSYSCASNAPAATTKLMFHRLGEHYFLYQAWTEGNNWGREFPKSKGEVQLAKNNSKPGLVIVSAKISH